MRITQSHADQPNSNQLSLDQFHLAQFEQQLRLNAQQGDAIAQFRLVDHFERKAFAENQLEAKNRIALLEQASQKKLGAASILLGRWYLTGHYVKQNVAQAILYFEHAASTCQDSYGFYQLSELFKTGQNIAKNPQKAQQYFKKAFDMGNPDAIYTDATQQLEQQKQHPERALAILKENYKKHYHAQSLQALLQHPAFAHDIEPLLIEYAFQDGFASALLAARYYDEAQFDAASHYVEFATQQRQPVGYYVRAMLEEQQAQADSQLIEQYLNLAAQGGHIKAMYQVAMRWFSQIQAQPDLAPQYLSTMIEYFARAAQAGYVFAEYQLGLCWLMGMGVQQNPNEAAAWFERAAQQGHIDAIFQLAMQLPLDHEQHLPLLKQAAQAGHTGAMLAIGQHAQQHHQAEQAIPWFNQANDAGDINAVMLLGLAYLRGQGVAVDAKQAVELLKQAGERGQSHAYFMLYQAYRDGVGVRKNKRSQAKYLKLAQDMGHQEALTLAE